MEQRCHKNVNSASLQVQNWLQTGIEIRCTVHKGHLTQTFCEWAKQTKLQPTTGKPFDLEPLRQIAETQFPISKHDTRMVYNSNSYSIYVRAYNWLTNDQESFVRVSHITYVLQMC